MTANAFYMIGGSRYLDKFIMENCTVTVPAYTETDYEAANDEYANRYILQTQGRVNTFSEIIFRNNIFHCADTYTLGFKLLAGANNATSSATTVNQITVENNTFVNVMPTNTALIMSSDINDITFSKNLLYFDQTIASDFSLRILHSYISYPEIASCSDNIVYNTNDIHCSMVYSNAYEPSTGIAEDPTPVSETPFSELSTFTLKPEYASYGAQR